jgi:lambda repressor-like predicted transcriptional regulator
MEPKPLYKLRQILNDRGIKSHWVAVKAGIHPTVFSQILNGWRVPKDEQVGGIAKALGVGVEEVV